MTGGAKSGSGTTCVVEQPPSGSRCFGTMCLTCISAGIDAPQTLNPKPSCLGKLNHAATQLVEPFPIPGERAVHPWQRWTVYKARR